MKITLEIPDGTMCAFFNYVYTDKNWDANMACHSISTEELHKGDTIVVGAMEESEDGE